LKTGDSVNEKPLYIAIDMGKPNNKRVNLTTHAIFAPAMMA
jgi:hypothetical protein